MSYQSPSWLRVTQEVQYGKTGQRLYFLPEVDGKRVVPSVAPVISILRSSGEATAIALAPATNDNGANGTGAHYYALDASNVALWTLGEDYQAIWRWTGPTGDTRVHEDPKLFDVVRFPLVGKIPITMGDLLNADPAIDNALGQATISVVNAAGVTSTEPLAKVAEDLFLHPAWAMVLEWVRSKGRRPALIADKQVLWAVTRYQALELLCSALHKKPSDKFDELAKKYAVDGEKAKNNTRLKYREGDTAAAGESVLAFAQPELSTGPSYGLGLGPRRKLAPLYVVRPK